MFGWLFKKKEKKKEYRKIVRRGNSVSTWLYIDPDNPPVPMSPPED